MHIKHIFILILVASCWCACEKYNDYQKYEKGGEITYTGKADSLKAFAGHNRVLLNFLLLSDPTITGARAYWNNYTDSATISIKRTSGVDTINMYIDSLAEGVYNFQVFTFDAKGDSSVPASITVKAYGADYMATLLTIPVQFSTVIPPDTAFVVWGTYDPTSGLVAGEAQYTDENGIVRDTVVPIGPTYPTSQFLSFTAGAAFQYRTLYLPEPTAIDTFPSPFQPLSIQ